jgi:ABC-2 type transport system permease protein
MAFMFFLPNILLSGFMFPFAGMPGWAQWIGEALPLTHYIRIVRGIMLKGSDLALLQTDVLASSRRSAFCSAAPHLLATLAPSPLGRRSATRAPAP